MTRKIACSNAIRYKAIRAPTCGCDMCNDAWAMAQRVLRGEPHEGDMSRDGLRIFDGKKWVSAQC